MSTPANARYNWIPGVILIATGVLILLAKFDILAARWNHIYPLCVIGFGVLFFVLGILHHQRGNVFPGTLFLSMGVFFALRNYELIEYFYFGQIWPVLLIALGLAFVALFASSPREWGVMIPGSILLFFGITFYIEEMRLMRWHRLAADYWALIIVCIGMSILISSFFRTKGE